MKSDSQAHFQIGDELEVKIETLVFSGPGLARTDKGVIFVDFAAAGDVAKVRITEVKSNYSRAEILSLITASESRANPTCKYFGQCGGCDWQHLKYLEQVGAKHTLLTDLFAKEFSTAKILPFVVSPKELGYRNRIQLTVNNAQLCFRKKRSHDFVPVNECPLVDPESNSVLKMKASKSGLAEGSRVQIFGSELEIRSPENKTAEPFAFSQVNSSMNELLVRAVIENAKQSSLDAFFDLHAGSGNFTFSLSENFSKIQGVGVEFNRESVVAAQTEARRRKYSPKRLQFLRGDSEHVFPRLDVGPSSLVFLDPPRAGCTPGLTRLLAKSKLKKITYVSCDAQTLARDLRILTSSGPYKLTQIQGFDMFPQTSHFEIMAVLES